MRNAEQRAGFAVKEGPAAGGLRWKRRLVAVTAAVLGAVAVWVVAEGLFGVDVRQPAFDAAQDTKDVSAPLVAVTSALGALVAWASLAVLERLTTSPRSAWAILALVVLLGSLGGPLGGSGVSDENRLALVAMHIVVAAVLIPMLYRTSPRAVPRAATVGGSPA